MTTDVAGAEASLDLENTTYVYDRSQGTTSELIIASTSSLAGEKVFLALLLSMCSLAFIANLAMLICLLVYKQAAKKTVNTFVCNQTILDLFATFFSAVTFVLHMAGYLKTKTGVLRIFTKQLEPITLGNARLVRI